MKQNQQPAGESHQFKALQQYTDAELLAELQRRGFECYRWPEEPKPPKAAFAWYDMGEWSDLQPDWELHTKLHK